MQQALRGILLNVGNKMGETVRQNLTATLLSYQSHAEVGIETKDFDNKKTKNVVHSCAMKMTILISFVLPGKYSSEYSWVPWRHGNNRS
jgi:hypothetical protein